MFELLSLCHTCDYHFDFIVFIAHFSSSSSSSSLVVPFLCHELFLWVCFIRLISTPLFPTFCSRISAYEYSNRHCHIDCPPFKQNHIMLKQSETKTAHANAIAISYIFCRGNMSCDGVISCRFHSYSIEFSIEIQWMSLLCFKSNRKPKFYNIFLFNFFQ